MLDACLTSIERNLGPSVPHEVVVVANGAPSTAVASLRERSPAIRIVVSRVNRGFAGGCNVGVQEARGDFLVFLNDDAEVQPGWLESLVETADRYPEAGAIGSRIDLPNGTVQEIGSVVWQDGSTQGVGRGLPVDTAPYQYVRPLDYCSASSLLVRRRVWDEIGGFDERYFPAYYEDVDLCLAIRCSGWLVLCQPRSRIVHRESGTAGEGFRDFLILRNRQHFCRKWAKELAEREPPRPGDPRALDRAIFRARGNPRPILIIDDRPPQRDVGSGFSVLLDAAREWVRNGHAVSVVATDRNDGDHVLLCDLGIEVHQDSPERVLARPNLLFDIVLISRPNNFERCGRVARDHQPQAALVYLAEALFHRRMERQLELVTDDAERGALETQAAGMRGIEMRIPRYADRIVTVSVEEAEILAAVEGACPIDTIPPLISDARLTATDFEERRNLLFVPGWLAGEASPNVDALQWFAMEVLPLVRRELPWVELLVTGGNPPQSVHRLAGNGIRLIGQVANLAEAYGSARIVVIPVRYGAGVKVKYVEALQHGVPVVSTSIGAEGVEINGPPPADVTDDPLSFANRIIELYTSHEAWRSRRGRIERLLERWQTEQATSWTEVIAKAKLERSAGHQATRHTA